MPRNADEELEDFLSNTPKPATRRLKETAKEQKDYMIQPPNRTRFVFKSTNPA